ncbi:MAG TPA: DinB family protein [Gemmatimonadaceae bacterium]|nr:DinB family protein [Gemmatimonadaceae bacterium]
MAELHAVPVAGSLVTLLSELLDGPPRGGDAYMLNGGDEGLLRSVDKLSPAAASARPTGGASIAAHVDHLVYGLSLLNQWSGGANPFDDADWTESWTHIEVTDERWRELRVALRREARQWVDAVRTSGDADPVALNTIVGSIAHLAYHLGAIRQIDRSIRGPSATGA